MLDLFQTKGLDLFANRLQSLGIYTANNTLVGADSGKIITNYGDSGAQNQTLPPATGSRAIYKFVVGVAQEIQVYVGAAGDAIIVGGSTSTDDGGADLHIDADDEGEYLELMDIADGVWLATQINGTWTVTQD